MSKGWYGNRHLHSLASKGIRVKARGTMMAEHQLFPHSHKVTSFDTSRLVFENKQGEEEILLILTGDFVKDIFDFTQKHRVQIKDSSGNTSNVTLGDIRKMLLLEPNSLIQIIESVYQNKLISWMGIPSDSLIVEYYPSLIGHEIKTELRPFSDEGVKSGIVIKEYTEDDSDYGKQTYYKVKFEDGTVKEKVYFTDIDYIDGKEKEKSMVYSEEIPILKEDLR